MAFSQVGNFLGKFLKLESREEKSKNVSDVIKNKFPKLEFKLIVKDKIIYFFDLSPAAKSELFLRKGEILKELKKIFGDLAPLDINFRKP